MRVPAILLTPLVVLACGGGTAVTRPDCPAGQTSLDGTCVSQPIADYVGCIRATGATVASDNAKSLSAAAGAAGVTGSTQAEVKDKLEKSYAKVSDENAQAIIHDCYRKTAPAPTLATPAGGSGPPVVVARDAAFARIVAGDAAGLFNLFNATMQAAVPLDKTTAFVQALGAKGRWVSVEGPLGETTPTHGAWSVRAEQGSWKMDVTVDADGRIGGLYVIVAQ